MTDWLRSVVATRTMTVGIVNGVDASDRGQTPGVGGESTVEFLKNRASKAKQSVLLVCVVGQSP